MQKSLALSKADIEDSKRRIEAAIFREPNTGCWLWERGCVGEYGTIRLRNSRVQVLAHRLSYAAWNGEIPDRLFVLHKCDTPPCVNPDHLFLGDHWDNMEDMHRKGRHGHGARNGQAKLTAAQVAEIRVDCVHSGRELALQFNVSASAISEIKIGRGWKRLGGPIRQKHLRGELRREAKLTEANVIEIRASALLQRELALRFGVTRECISRVQCRKSWKHI